MEMAKIMISVPGIRETRWMHAGKIYNEEYAFVFFWRKITRKRSGCKQKYSKKLAKLC